MGEESKAFRVEIIRPGGKRVVDRLRHKWADNVSKGVRRGGFGGDGWRRQVLLQQSRTDEPEGVDE